MVMKPFLFFSGLVIFSHFCIWAQNVKNQDLLTFFDPPGGLPGVILSTFWGNFGIDSGYLQDLETKRTQLLLLFVSVQKNSKTLCVCVCVERVSNAVNQMNQNKKEQRSVLCLNVMIYF